MKDKIGERSYLFDIRRERQIPYLQGEIQRLILKGELFACFGRIDSKFMFNVNPLIAAHFFRVI